MPNVSAESAMGGWASWPSFLPSLWKLDETIGEWYSSLTPLNRDRKRREICWAIWRERNVRVFDKTETRLITKLKDEASLCMQSGAKNLTALVSHRFHE
jgi:hypothetical protein